MFKKQSEQTGKKDPFMAEREEYAKIGKEVKTRHDETRTVRLLFKKCCGCGCDDYTVTRVVPYDSPLEDGDRIREIQRGDVW